jgi:tetrahydromethanopterin S-methyltransferase subunit E
MVGSCVSYRLVEMMTLLTAFAVVVAAAVEAVCHPA